MRRPRRRARAPKAPLRSRILARAKVTGRWAICVLVAVGHTLALSLLSPSDSIGWKSIDWALVLVPALVTLVALPSSLRHWRRWLTFVAVLFVTDTAWTLYVLVIGETWILHREWVTDRAPAELGRLVPASVRHGVNAIAAMRRSRRTERRRDTSGAAAEKAKTRPKATPTPKSVQNRPARRDRPAAARR